MTASNITVRSIVTVSLQQITLAGVVFVLVIGWLQIPDANALEVFASVVLALLIALVAGASESAIALRLTGKRFTLRSILIGTATVLIAGLLWWIVSAGIDHLSANDALRAGYLNSRFPASLRNIFTFEHLVTLLGWSWAGLRFLVAGILATVAFAVATCDAPLRGTLVVLRSGRYWLSLLLFVVIGLAITGVLLGWTPGHGLRVEALSLVIRLVLVIVLNAAAVALLLHVMAHAVLTVQSAGTADPDVSQPRTADIP